MASLNVTLIDPTNKGVKTLKLPMPDGFVWAAETQHVVDFISKEQVYLVAGIQLDAKND